MTFFFQNFFQTKIVTNLINCALRICVEVMPWTRVSGKQGELGVKSSLSFEKAQKMKTFPDLHIGADCASSVFGFLNADLFFCGNLENLRITNSSLTFCFLRIITQGWVLVTQLDEFDPRVDQDLNPVWFQNPSS